MTKENNFLVSVVINCFNGERFLKKAIDSVYSQTYKNWEIIFLDNCSTDGSVKILDGYDEKIRYFKTDKKIPLYAARNVAIKKSKGAAIAFLDCDDEWTPRKLEAQMSLFVQGSKIVYGRFVLVDESGQKIEKDIANPSSGFITNKILMRNPISICSILISKEILDRYLFNSEYNLIGDFDLWFRLSLIHQFDYVDEVVEFSRQHDSNLSDIKAAEWIKEQRRFWLSNLKIIKPAYTISYFLYILKVELRSIQRKIKSYLL